MIVAPNVPSIVQRVYAMLIVAIAKMDVPQVGGGLPLEMILIVHISVAIALVQPVIKIMVSVLMDANMAIGDLTVKVSVTARENRVMLMEIVSLVDMDVGEQVALKVATVIMELIAMILANAPVDVQQDIGDKIAMFLVSVKMEKAVMARLGLALMVVVKVIGVVIATRSVSVIKKQTVMTTLDIAHKDVLMEDGEKLVMSIVFVMEADYATRKQAPVQMDVLLDSSVLAVVIHAIANQVIAMIKPDIVTKDVHLDIFQTLTVYYVTAKILEMHVMKQDGAQLDVHPDIGDPLAVMHASAMVKTVISIMGHA